MANKYDLCGCGTGAVATVRMPGGDFCCDDCAQGIEEDEGGMYEDQLCRGKSCGAAPLGCSDNRYCPKAPMDEEVGFC